MNLSDPPTVHLFKDQNGALEHYEGVLRDLTRQLSRLDLERQRIKVLMESLKSFIPDAEDNGSGRPNVESSIASNEYANISLLAAIERYLERERTPQSTGAIIQALIEGGYQSTAKKFSMVVVPALYRHLKRTKGSPNSVISKFGSNWGLTKWQKIGGMP